MTDAGVARTCPWLSLSKDADGIGEEDDDDDDDEDHEDHEDHDNRGIVDESLLMMLRTKVPPRMRKMAGWSSSGSSTHLSVLLRRTSRT